MSASLLPKLSASNFTLCGTNIDGYEEQTEDEQEMVEFVDMLRLVNDDPSFREEALEDPSPLNHAAANGRLYTGIVPFGARVVSIFYHWGETGEKAL